jgi:hypothetical protein
MIMVRFDWLKNKNSVTDIIEVLEKRNDSWINLSFHPYHFKHPSEENILAYVINEAKIECLNLSSNHIGFMSVNQLQYLSAMFKKCKKIKLLYLNNNSFNYAQSNNGIFVLGSMLENSSICSLNISKNYFLANLEKLADFFYCIKSSNITDIDLSNNSFTQVERYSENIYKSLANALNTTKITSLRLLENMIGALSVKQWSYFCNFIANSNLVSLDLSRNIISQISANQWCMLGNAISKSKIKYLNLAENQLGDLNDSQFIGFRIFLEKIDLVSLNLSQNKLYLFTSQFWQITARSLINITKLDLSGNRLGEMINSKWLNFTTSFKSVKMIELSLASNMLYKLDSERQNLLLDLMQKGNMLRIDLNNNAISQTSPSFAQNFVSLFSMKKNRSLASYYHFTISDLANLFSELGCVIGSKNTARQSIGYDKNDFISFFLKIFFYKQFIDDILDYQIVRSLEITDKILSTPIGKEPKLKLAMSMIYAANPVLHHLNFTQAEIMFGRQYNIKQAIYDSNLYLTMQYYDIAMDINNYITKQGETMLMNIVKRDYSLKHIWELLVIGADPFRVYTLKDYSKISAADIAAKKNFANIVSFFDSFRDFINHLSSSQDNSDDIKRSIYLFLDQHGIACGTKDLQRYELATRSRLLTDNTSMVGKFKNRILQERQQQSMAQSEL